MLNDIPRPNDLSREDFEYGKRLVSDLMRGAISRDEFDKECAYFTLQCGFDDLKPKQEPERPYELINYDTLSDGEKEKVGESFWRQPEIFGYMSQRSKALFDNDANRS